ncbi:MAG: peptidylprolyl isomerase [Bacteroidetes bacterium]|nr:peptidylprolyl isomerase [Bacteroidota bacterium]
MHTRHSTFLDKRRWWIFGYTSEFWEILPILLLLVGCSPPLSERDQALAHVNGHPITVGDFERSYVQTLIQSGQNDTPEARYEHLDLLIEEHLWYEEALRRNLNSDSLLSEFTELALKRAVGGRYYEIEFLEQLPQLTETEIRQAFARYKQPMIVRHLFYRNEDDARTAHARLNAGNLFLDEAQVAFKTETYDSTAGWLGEIRYFQVDDAFAEAAFALSVGQYSDPVRSRQGWHIIKVEDRMRTPIIAESEFQNRKDGIAGLLRIRKRRLEGDRFVRTFMENRNVQINAEGLRSLRAALGRITNNSVSLDDTYDTAALPLTPETLLATFTMNGSTHTFTGDDYFFWLPELPPSEVTSNTAASLGRALRNEALALAGLELGLSKDQIVQEDIASSTRTYLANSMQRLQPDSTLLIALRSTSSIRVDTVLFQQIMVN